MGAAKLSLHALALRKAADAVNAKAASQSKQAKLYLAKAKHDEKKHKWEQRKEHMFLRKSRRAKRKLEVMKGAIDPKKQKAPHVSNVIKKLAGGHAGKKVYDADVFGSEDEMTSLESENPSLYEGKYTQGSHVGVVNTDRESKLEYP